MTNIELWRRQRQINQETLAKKIGMSPASYQAIASGRLRPSAEQRAKLRAFFRCDDQRLDQLLAPLDLVSAR